MPKTNKTASKEAVNNYIGTLKSVGNISDSKLDDAQKILDGSYRNSDTTYTDMEGNGIGRGSKTYVFEDGTKQRVDTYKGRMAAVTKLLGLTENDFYDVNEVINANDYLSKKGRGFGAKKALVQSIRDYESESTKPGLEVISSEASDIPDGFTLKEDQRMPWYRRALGYAATGLGIAALVTGCAINKSLKGPTKYEQEAGKDKKAKVEYAQTNKTAQAVAPTNSTPKVEGAGPDPDEDLSEPPMEPPVDEVPKGDGKVIHGRSKMLDLEKMTVPKEELDTDKDGEVSVEETKAYLAKQEAKEKAENKETPTSYRAAIGNTGYTVQTNESKEKSDNMAERLKTAKPKRLAEVDTNGDKNLTVKEIREYTDRKMAEKEAEYEAERKAAEEEAKRKGEAEREAAAKKKAEEASRKAEKESKSKPKTMAERGGETIPDQGERGETIPPAPTNTTQTVTSTNVFGGVYLDAMGILGDDERDENASGSAYIYNGNGSFFAVEGGNGEGDGRFSVGTGLDTGKLRYYGYGDFTDGSTVINPGIDYTTEGGTMWSANGYFGEGEEEQVVGGDLGVSVPIVKGEKGEVRGNAVAYSLNVGDEDVSGIKIGPEATWNMNDNWSLTVNGDWNSNEDLDGSEWNIRGGLVYKWGKKKDGKRFVPPRRLHVYPTRLEERLGVGPYAPGGDKDDGSRGGGGNGGNGDGPGPYDPTNPGDTSPGVPPVTDPNNPNNGTGVPDTTQPVTPVETGPTIPTEQPPTTP